MLGFLIAVFSLTGIFFAYDLVFDDDLLTVFDDLEDQYTETEFIVDGNEFAGLVFWQATEELDDDVVIDLAGETEDLTCHYQVRGLYLNPQRGNRLRPLDAESLAALTGIDDGSYDNLELTWWRYVGCEDDDDDYIYGQITHTYDGQTYKLVAGVEYSGNTYVQNFEENALRLSENIGSGYFRDSWGGVFLSYGEGTPSNDDLPDRFSFPTERDADLDEYYISDEIDVDWLSDDVQVLARLSELSQWALFINGDYVGTSGYVENDDEVEIELKSSDDYDEITSATIYIGERSATYYIITKSEDDDDDTELSLAEQIRVIMTFKTLIDAYGDNTDKLEEFLYTFKSMLEDEVDMADGNEAATLEYLLEVIDAYLLENMFNGNNDLPFGEDVYIAPNCKSYEFKYHSERMAYYSPNFVYMHYFISEESMIAYIDENNPGNRRIIYSIFVFKIISIGMIYNSLRNICLYIPISKIPSKIYYFVFRIIDLRNRSIEPHSKRICSYCVWSNQ